MKHWHFYNPLEMGETKICIKKWVTETQQCRCSEMFVCVCVCVARRRIPFSMEKMGTNRSAETFPAAAGSHRLPRLTAASWLLCAFYFCHHVSVWQTELVRETGCYCICKIIYCLLSVYASSSLFSTSPFCHFLLLPLCFFTSPLFSPYSLFPALFSLSSFLLPSAFLFFVFFFFLPHWLAFPFNSPPFLSFFAPCLAFAVCHFSCLSHIHTFCVTICCPSH